MYLFEVFFDMCSHDVSDSKLPEKSLLYESVIISWASSHSVSWNAFVDIINQFRSWIWLDRFSFII